MHGTRTPIFAMLIIALLATPTVGIAQESDDRWPNPTGATIVEGRIVGGDKLTDDLATPGGHPLGSFESASWSNVSDPRLEGDIIIATSATGGGLGPTQDSDVLSDTILIENGEGTWVGQPSAWFWLEDDTISDRIHVLSGTGAYAGSTALLQVAGDLDWTGGWDVSGIIFEGVVPEPPTFPVSLWQAAP